MSKDFSQKNLDNKEKTLEDFFKIRGGTLSLTGTLQTENFIKGKRGVEIKNEGLSAGSINIAGATQDSLTTTIPGALKHTGNTAGFYNVDPLAKQTVTLGNTNGAVAGLAIGAAYSQKLQPLEMLQKPLEMM
jgi:hypothetical protein